MAKFVLEIEMTTVDTPDHLADVLARTAEEIRSVACEDDLGAVVRDRVGIIVGKWEMRPTVTVEQLGTEFVRILRTWASDEEWVRMLADNAEETSDYICHSHDFCDANMAMEAAFHNLRLKTCFDVSEEGEETPEYMAANKMWNDAWDWAKKNHLTGVKN